MRPFRPVTSLLGVIAIVASALAGCSTTTSADDETQAIEVGRDAVSYPRLATYLIETYVGPELEEAMGKTDVTVLDVEAAALDRAPLDRMRRDNPKADLLAYLTSEEIWHGADPAERPIAVKRFKEIPPAHWLLEPGSTTASAIDAATTRIKVADPSRFTVQRPRSDFYGEDEPTYLLIDGEHVKLTAIEGDELVVERGYQSTAAPHRAGARIAAHVVFFAGTWMLNIAKTAPADARRGQWRDMLAKEVVEMVAAGPWTGAFLDVCFEDISWLNGGLLDVDGDGVADDKTEASKSWSAGMGMLVDTVREKVGPNVPVMANPGGQNCPHRNLDGILLEGWPIGLPEGFLAFDVGLERYLEWSKKGRGLTIANGFSPKIGFGVIEQGADEIARADYQAMRFGLGVALLGNGLYTFDNGPFGHYVAWWYDEYDGGGLGKGWLGRPKGEPRIEARFATREFEHGLVVVNTSDAEVSVDVPAGFAKIRGSQDRAHNDGAPVSGRLAVAAKDAYLLRRVR